MLHQHDSNCSFLNCFTKKTISLRIDYISIWRQKISRHTKG